MEEMICWNAKS